jgi:hypothetical protein
MNDTNLLAKEAREPVKLSVIGSERLLEQPSKVCIKGVSSVILRAVTDRRNGAGDDRHNGASFWQAERTSRQA